MGTIKKFTLIVISVLLAIFALSMIGRVGENVDAGEIVVIQDPYDGELHVYSNAGWQYQNFGKATHYKRSFQFWFSQHTDQGDAIDQSIKVKFNDGGHATISGSTRVNLPTDEKSMIKLHKDYGSQESVEQALIRTTIEKAVYFTGPLMTSKESYAEKRNNLLSYIEDQAQNGVYKTLQKEVKTKDELSSNEKTVTQVEPLQLNGVFLRQEVSPLKTYNLSITALSINSVDYDKIVDAQISSQQQAIMQVQTAIANSKKAEQEAITVEQQGKALAAKAKWEQEVIKAKAVTQAQQELEVQELATKTADSYKKEQILIGQGNGERKRAEFLANGNLEQKLEAYKSVQKYWADAFSKYSGSIVPQIQSGGSQGNGAVNFMELMGAKAARDLSLDLKNK